MCDILPCCVSSHVTWLFHKCDMTLSYAWQDSFICVTWLFHMCDMTLSYAWHDSFICVTWLFHMRDRTLSYVWHDSFMCDMTLSYVWHDICRTWLFRFVWPWYLLPHIAMCVLTCRHTSVFASHICEMTYGVATISMLLKFTGLFCRI